MNPSSLSRARAPRQDTDCQSGEHPRGLELHITVDEANAKRCIATLTLRDVRVAAQSMSPSSILFAAMEQLATHVPAVLRGDTANVWVLRTAAITHYRPGWPDQRVTLAGFIEWDGIPGEPIVIHTEACDGSDGLLAEADYTIVPVSAKRFQRGNSIPLATGSFEIPRAFELDGRAD
jgi:hypothetical protein